MQTFASSTSKLFYVKKIKYRITQFFWLCLQQVELRENYTNVLQLGRTELVCHVLKVTSKYLQITQQYLF